VGHYIPSFYKYSLGYNGNGGVIEMKTHENLVEELARLSPEELKSVLDNLGKRLEKDKKLNMAEKIIKEYKPALEELAK
jgi:hypothetical protein